MACLPHVYRLYTLHFFIQIYSFNLYNYIFQKKKRLYNFYNNPNIDIISITQQSTKF